MKVLFIGFGSIAQKHYLALKHLEPDATIYALKSGKQASALPEVEDIFSWEEVPNDISFAIISNPTYKHTETLEKLIQFNVPLFIEKPISHELEGLEDLKKKITKQKVVTYVACNLRFLPVLGYLKNVLLPKIPRIEEVSVYCGSYLPHWRPTKDYQDIYSANKSMGGGVHLDLFHEFDYIYWLFGQPQSSSGILRNVSHLQISSADFASYRLVYPDFLVSLTLNYYRLDAKRTIEIITPDNTYLANLLDNSILDKDGKIVYENYTFTVNDTYLSQMEFFLGLIHKSKEPFNTFSESFEILKICLKSEYLN